MKNEKKMTAKTAARIELGLLDPSGKGISDENMTKEGLLDTLVIVRKSREAERLGAQQALKTMESRLYNAMKAKRLANQRADIAERKLKKIAKALADDAEVIK